MQHQFESYQQIVFCCCVFFSFFGVILSLCIVGLWGLQLTALWFLLTKETYLCLSSSVQPLWRPMLQTTEAAQLLTEYLTTKPSHSFLTGSSQPSISLSLLPWNLALSRFLTCLMSGFYGCVMTLQLIGALGFSNGSLDHREGGFPLIWHYIFFFIFVHFKGLTLKQGHCMILLL